MLLEIFKLTCLCRYFELEAAKAIREKRIKIPTYLSVGTEHIPASISVIKKDWLVFPQHRCHSWFLCFGGTPESLVKELLGRIDGCNGGKGGSASVSWKPNFFGHSGLLGDQVPVAVGASLASNKETLVVLGDAAAEEDYVLASLGFAVSKNCPILFICEDNNLSILTTKEVRRKWSIVEVAKGFGMPAFDIPDDPEIICKHIENRRLPMLLNINAHRHLWHAGAGCDGEPPYDQLNRMREKLSFPSCEIKIKESVEEIWENLN